MKGGAYGLVFDPRAIGLDVRGYTGNEVLVICPFHGDQHASAEFNVTSGLFMCFACGASCNAKTLAKKLGGVVNSEVAKRAPRATDFDWKPLLGAPLAYDNEYLLNRKVTNEQVEKYGIRAVSQGVIFPLHNSSGRITGTIARRYKGEPKYQVFGERPPLWPMPLVVSRNPRKRLALVEGVFGVLCAERANIEAVATLTCRANDDACAWLNRGPITVFYDDDKAGYLGCGKVIKNVLTANAMISGLEYDSISSEQWQECIAGRNTTREHSRLAELSGNKQLYYNVVQPYRKQWKR